MTTSRDPDRLVRAFLEEGEEQLDDRLYDVVRAEIEHRRQRVFIGPWRFPIMNRFMAIGAGAVAVLVILFAGAQLFGSSGNIGGPGEASASPEASVADSTPEATPSPTPLSGSEPRSLVLTQADDPVQVTVEIAEPGWNALPGFDGVDKGDDGLDPPETVGGALVAWGFPAGTAFNVYGDPCQWESTTPESPATTVDEIATALSAQASRDATDPVDVTIGGHAGKAVTLHVPMSYEVPGATREEEFADCDEGTFASYGTVGASEPTRYHQGPGQVDEFWIIDVDGAIVILDAMYSPATPAEVVEELRAIAESATFEAP